MRDETQSNKETWESGTKSALAGGVTVVVDQPNTIPPLTSPARIRERVFLAQSRAYTRFAINGAVTTDADLVGMWHAGVFAFGETFAGPSSYGDAVSADVLRRAMHQIAGFGGYMTIHAEQVREGNDCSLCAHDQLRPISGEVQTVRDILSLNTVCCNLYLCHLSSAEAIEAIPDGAAIREVTPHHLFLSQEMFACDDTFGKGSIPIRSEKKRKEVCSCWKRIDVIASDHAPHTLQEKRQAFENAPSGIPGVETMVPLLMACVKEKKIPLVDVIAKTSMRPSEILGMRNAGFSPGDRADFAIYSDELTRITADMLHSAAGWTPYEGMKAIFPEQTILCGKIVYDNGDFYRPGCSDGDENVQLWHPGRGYILKEET